MPYRASATIRGGGKESRGCVDQFVLVNRTDCELGAAENLYVRLVGFAKREFLYRVANATLYTFRDELDHSFRRTIR
jgi:hypothetical protein